MINLTARQICLPVTLEKFLNQRHNLFLMKVLYIFILAIPFLIGCNESNQTPINSNSKDSSNTPTPQTLETQPKKINPAPQEQLTKKAPGIPIWEAASLGAIKQVREHLESGADVNSLDQNGRTPLHWASTENVIRKLISAGGDINSKDGRGMTPLHCYIIENNKTKNAKILLEAGAKVNAITSSGHTPLHYATSNNKYGFVAFLIENMADINAKSKSGVTPLHSASLSDDSRIIELLLSKGAKVNALTKEGVKVYASGTPLDWAQKGKKEKAISLLRKNGAKTVKELKAN